MPPVPAPLRRAGLRIEPAPGGPQLCVRDAWGVSPERAGVVLDARQWRLAQAFDGERDAADLARAQAPPADPAEVLALARRLSAALLLRDEAFERAAAERLDRLRAAGRREPLGPGAEYPHDAFDLRAEVGGLVANDWDMPPVDSLAGAWTTAAPHRRAGPLYARTFAALRSRERDATRVLLLGAAECELGRLLVPLDLPLATPLGAPPVDREGLAALGLHPGRDLLVHTTSLALERQALFLRVVLPRAVVLPVLVSSLGAARAALDPAGDEDVERAVEALLRCARLPGGAVLLCAADLQRVAGSFGGAAPPDAAGVPYSLVGATGRRVRDADTAVVDAATRLRPEELWSAALEGAGPRGAGRLLAPYLALRIVAGVAPEARGSTLGYLQLPGAGEIATAASVVWH